MAKTHLQDIRLKNNAGMSFPVCRANDRLLNTELRVEFAVGDRPEETATCLNCQRAYRKRYPWAVRAAKVFRLLENT